MPENVDDKVAELLKPMLKKRLFVVTDVTEREQAEQKFRGLLESAPVQ
jgi:hypothetical protein